MTGSTLTGDNPELACLTLSRSLASPSRNAARWKTLTVLASITARRDSGEFSLMWRFKRGVQGRYVTFQTKLPTGRLERKGIRLVSKHNTDQALSWILFSGLDSSGHGVGLRARNSACGTVTRRSKTHARRQVLTQEKRRKVEKRREAR